MGPVEVRGLRREPGRRPRLPLRSERARPDGRDHIQLHAVYFQSTFSPLSVHIQFTFSPRTWIHVDPMAFNVEGGN